MFAEVFQGAAQRAFSKQNEMGKTLALHRAHPSLREGVQIRAARRKSQALYSSGCQRLSETRAELRIAVVQHIAMAAQISGFRYRCENLSMCDRRPLSESASVRSPVQTARR